MYNPPKSSPYRAPASQIHETLEEIEKQMKQRDSYTLIVSGDLNLPGADWNSMLSDDDYELSLLNNFETHQLQQILPCKRNQSLDVCLTQSPDSIELAEVDKNLTREYSINGKRCSDHQAFRTTISIDISATNPAPKVKHAYHKVDWKEFNSHIRDHPFSPYCFSNVDELVDQWYLWIEKIIEILIPRVTQHRANLPPWISSATSHELKILGTMKRKYERAPTLNLLIKIKRREKLLNEQILTDQAVYEDKLFKSRRMSDLQKYLKSLRKSKHFPDEMYYNVVQNGQETKKTATTDSEKCNLFNDFFSDVFTKDGKINEPSVYPKQRLNYLRISEEEIERQLLGLQANKACGPDNIRNIILKNAPALAKSLKLIFQTCLNKGKFPESWKTSEITPIYKENDKADITQYRPISLLKNVSKVFEKVIFERLYPPIERTLSDSQHGFRKKRSAVLQLILFTDELYQQLESKKCNDIRTLYVDFRKAFDKVAHKRLIQKLENIGLGGKLLQLLESYLTNRTQRVKIGTSKSKTRNVTSGVPQGSILGPLMFIIYIDDLPEEISDIPAFGYPDDFKAITHGEHECETTLGEIQKWSKANHMDLNVSKSKTLLIRGDLAQRDEAGLETVATQKHLGVVMSRNLSWSANCQLRTTKAWKAFYTLKRNVSSRTSMETKLNAYIGYVVPVLTYASQVWYPSKTDMKSIEKIQQKATKWICGGNDEYHQRLETLKILPLSMYMEMHDVLYLLSILEGNYYVPEDKLPKRKENETRQKQEFELPKHRLHKSDENFFFRATKLFNIISRTTEKPMTKKLLTEMYQNYFHRSYNELDSCTWRHLCNCGICNPMKKLVPNEN
ncbi:uncharacterized protein LOC142341320 [Convolutriloba macropyga]|uniref:uncharacterized protein LOC142341320 n=1 Tax=Convolutriloba macropyga TaxID=536237 RepID=UPI003F528F62